MGNEREAVAELSLIQTARTFHILRVFANKYSAEPRERYLAVEAVRKALQQIIGVELRHDDVKVCIRYLAQKGLLEEAPVGDNVVYRISPSGYDYWLKGRPLFSMIM